jgi:phosphoglycerate dehydrogenase-like enzyme
MRRQFHCNPSKLAEAAQQPMAESSLPRVLITIPFDPAGVELLRETASVDLRPDLPPAELEAVIGDYQALIIGSETPVPDRTIEYAYQLQVIGVAGSSLERLNVSAARAQAVEVINVPDRRTLALAEQTLRLLLTLAFRQGNASLAGATLGIVGFGRVGHEVARRARAFDMRVLVHQPRLTPELALEVGAELRELRSLLAEADYVSLHLPTRAETRQLIAAGELECCRPQSYLINAGSLDALDLAALQQALASGRLAGAALVLPPGGDGALPEPAHPSLLVAQAAGPSQAEVERDIAVNLARHVIEHLRKRRLSNPLSLRVVPLELVLPHEHFDPERVRDLAARLESETTLVNPPVVVEWQGKYIVLDGATRVTAFKHLGYPHIVVQVVASDDERLVLHTWYHAVCGTPLPALMAHLQPAAEYGLVPVPREALRARAEMPDGRQPLCSLVTKAGESYLVYPAEGVDGLSALNALVARYTEAGTIRRTLTTDLHTLEAEAPDLAALVIFPQFTLDVVLGAAAGGQLLPAGITRFVIPGRILRLHADLARLRADEPLARKNYWLNQMLADKLARRRVRFYQEPVVLLDE